MMKKSRSLVVTGLPWRFTLPQPSVVSGFGPSKVSPLGDASCFPVAPAVSGGHGALCVMGVGRM